jgi:thioredoxin-related protein
MRNRLAIPIGIAGLLAFIAAGWMLTEDPAPKESSTTSVEWVSFDEGLQLAKEQKKKVLVDVYTDWCTWCKKMDAETYAHALVTEELRNNFISIKLNAESSDQITFNGQTMTSAQFARSAGVTGYPTTLFLDERLQPITVVPGYAPPDKFSKILGYFSGDHYKNKDFQSYLDQIGG